MITGEADIVTTQQPPKRIPRPPHARGLAVATATRGAMLPRILPFATYIAFIIAADVLARGGVAPADLRWLYPIKIGAVLALLLAWRRHYAELTQRPSRRQCAVALGTGVAVFLLWIALDAGWMQIGHSAGFNPEAASGDIDWLLVAARAGGAALVVPVMEELFWRSFLLRWLQQHDFLTLRPALVRGKAIAVSVLLFGIEHHLWLAGLVAGTAYTLLYLRSETLWTPILGHAVTNGLLAAWILVTGNWTYW